MGSATTISYFICRCGTLTTERSHFTSNQHVRIDEIIAPLSLTDADMRCMRDFASEFATDFRTHENEMRAHEIVNGYRKGPQQLYITDDGLGAARGLVFAFALEIAVVVVAGIAWGVWRWMR